MTEQAYFDRDDKPALLRDGYAKIGWKYSAPGNITEIAHGDHNGKLTAPKSYGYARVVRTYDEDDNWTGSSYYGAEGKPVRVAVVVTSVEPSSQGERLGLKAGDDLLSYDGKDVRSYASFIYDRGKERAGAKPSELVVVRTGKSFRVQVNPGLLRVSVEDRVLPK